MSWPLSLLALTVCLVLLANVVTGCGRPHRGHDVDEIKERAEHAVEHVLDDLDATDDQLARVQAIVADGIDELAAARGPREDMRETLQALLTAEDIDREAMEVVRLRHLDRAETMSRIATERIADVLETLTVEQRRQLAEKAAKHRRRHRRWH